MMKEERIEQNFNMRFIPVRLPSTLPDPDEYVLEKGTCSILRFARNCTTIVR